MTLATALALWRRALTEEIGVIIALAEVGDKHRIENTLYEARKAAGDPSLDVLMIVRPGDKPEELWIIKKTTDMKDVKP